MRQGRCVALTGGIACGKSTVAELWRRWGAEALDADQVAHGLIARGGECAEAVVREFGPRVRAAHGGVDRSVLGAIVFGDSSARERLEALLHPAVIRRMRAWADGIRREGRIGVAVVPLLFEAGMEKEWDAVVCVAADEKTMLERLAARGLSPAEAKARIASQWPVREKMARADRVIENSAPLRHAWQQVLAGWRAIPGAPVVSAHAPLPPALRRGPAGQWRRLLLYGAVLAAFFCGWIMLNWINAELSTANKAAILAACVLAAGACTWVVLRW